MISSIDEAKQAARTLRASVAASDVVISHSQALEHVSHAAGAADWNTLAARLRAPRAGSQHPSSQGGSPVSFTRTVPVLRIFDEAKAREFYVDYLGFGVDWEHRYEPDLPLYLQVSRAGLVLHLSEHHGDGTPGSVVYAGMRGIHAFHAELTAKHYRYYRPGLEREPYGETMTLEDGFGNGLRFCEPTRS